MLPNPGLWGEAAHTHLQRHGRPTVVVPVLGMPWTLLSATLPNAEAELSVSEAAWKGRQPPPAHVRAGTSPASMPGRGPETGP